MKLKTLLLLVAALAVASIIVYFVQRPSVSPAGTDPRVGEPLLATSVAEQAGRLQLTDAGNTVELVRQPDGTWRVTSFHDLPADFGKLSRFVKDLTDAKVERLVTSNPAALERLGFGATSLRLSRENGEKLWAVDLGRTAEGGGRFVRYEDEEKAYRARLTAWLDTTSRNWADSSLLTLKPEQVAKVEIEFPAPEGGRVMLSRGTAEEPFAAGEGGGRPVRQGTVTSLLSSLSTLRFTDVSEPQAEEVAAARTHLRRVVLTTFDGETIAIALGRKPEQAAPKAADAAAATTDETEADTEHTAEPATETIPAGPVFAFIEGDAQYARLASASARVAFKVSDYIFTSLPKAPPDLFEPDPPSEEASVPPSEAPVAEDAAAQPPAP